MTPTQQKAVKMAIEALEQLQGGCTDSEDGTVEAITVWCPEVIEALRAALAEQDDDKAVNMAPLSDEQIKDPCPGCKVGGVCRTPKCGRLALPKDHPLRTGIKGD